MKKALLVVGVLAIAALLFAAVALPRPLGAQDVKEKPTLIPIDVQRPAPEPPDKREVAILTLVVNSDGKGNVEKVAIEHARIINAYAPNVLGRPGPWTVEVVGKGSLRYGIQDPRRTEVFPVEGEKGVQSVYSRSVVWELVVPLYLFEQDLGAEAILIFDQTGEPVFKTEVLRDQWK